MCGATNLGEALRRIGEGAAMIRSKGEAGTGNVVEAVRHMRAIVGGIRAWASSTRRADDGGEEPWCSLRAGAVGRGERAAPGGAVHRRRHSDPGRRRAR